MNISSNWVSCKILFYETFMGSCIAQPVILWQIGHNQTPFTVNVVDTSNIYWTAATGLWECGQEIELINILCAWISKPREQILNHAHNLLFSLYVMCGAPYFLRKQIHILRRNKLLFCAHYLLKMRELMIISSAQFSKPKQWISKSCAQLIFFPARHVRGSVFLKETNLYFTRELIIIL